MEMNSPYDEWSKNIHAVITFLQPFFDDWRSYASLVSALLGVGVLIMENQVLLRMRMGRWEIVGYVLWCIISSVLGPLFDIAVMLGLLAYCRQKSAHMQITNEAIAKALLPPPMSANYRIMGLVCLMASFLTLCSNVLYMLRGWEEPLPFYDWSSNGIRWMTSQIWYAIGMIFLFHVVTRPAQSGVVLFGKLPRDLWAFKWYLCVLYFPVRYLLLELCGVYRESKHILIPLEIIVDIVLYNGPFLTILLRLLYLAWKVAYDEAVLTGAIYEDGAEAVVDSQPFSIFSLFSSDSDNSNTRHTVAATRPGGATQGENSSSAINTKGRYGDSLDKRNTSTNNGGSPPAYESRDHTSNTLSPRTSPKASPRNTPRTSPKNSSPLRNVVFSMDSMDEEDDDEAEGGH
ncbi:hypothetical protein BGZ58_002373 [Dissophora ornata]|nr:hypothetical protein BGZ58_002373 [Dissophora ornata]